MSDIRIRPAAERDIEPLARLFDAYRQFYQQPADETRARRFIGQRMESNDALLLVAENERRELVGFCLLYPSFCSVLTEPIYLLYDLFVAPSARRNGVARALLTAARQTAERNGIARMDLSTARTNTEAQALYESLGWKRDETFFVYNLTITHAG